MSRLRLIPLLLCAELRRKWFVEASKCAGQDSANAQGDGRVSVDQAWSVFLILAGGAGIAFVVALFEVLYYKKIFSGECLHSFYCRTNVSSLLAYRRDAFGVCALQWSDALWKKLRMLLPQLLP